MPKVVKKIEEFDGEVLWTQDTHSDDYLETQEGRLLPVKHCICASNGWQIHSSVKAAIQRKAPADDQLNGFEKKTFGSLALAGRLYPEVAFGDGIEEIVLVGLCTDTAQQELELANIEKQTAKVQAEKDREVAQINAEKAVIEAEAKADALRIAAEAEADANRKIAASLTGELIEKIKYEQWNGELPTVTGSTSIISLDP